MKRPYLFLALVCLLGFSRLSLAAADKSQFDLDRPPREGSSALSKTEDLAGGRMLLTRAAAEASMIDGAYFTLGTTSGIAQSTLDDKCTITYGHPYAKTSYPLVHLDGVWSKPEAVFSMTGSFPQRAGDSLTLVYTLETTMTLRFVIRFENAAGSLIRISSSLTNADNASHTMGLGLVIDPSVGKGGDCALWLDGTRIVRDTAIAVQAQQSPMLTLAERSSVLSGLGAAVSFPASTPSTIIVGNWNDSYKTDTPVFTPSDVRTLYDALVKIFWSPVVVPSHGTITKDVVVTLLDPKFGPGTFCRWDLPVTQSVENGIPFPKSFTSTVTCANGSGAPKNAVSVELSLPSDVQSSPAARSAYVPALSSVSMPFALSVKDLYENKVVTATVLCKENGTITDSLALPFRICNAPLSDTGLVVSIDSVITQRAPAMSLIFSVQKKTPLQYVGGLVSDNVFLYENQNRITGFTLGKDTTGGAGSVDIVFVFDVTGSMSNSITGVKNNIMEFADSLANRGVDYRLGMVTFLDAVESVYDFTSDPALFKSRVSQQYAHGGDDLPENSLDALYRATELTFRPTARKVFIWITDASYHEKDIFTKRTKQEVIDRLLTTGVTVHAIGTSTFQTDWYNPITNATGGNYYNITGNFRDILLDIGNLRGSSRYLLTYSSALGAQAARQLTLSIHYAGYGGFATTSIAGLPAALTAASAPFVRCYPNPFNPQTTIRLDLPKDAHASLVIYNIMGEEVNRFTVSGAEGRAECVWDASNTQGTNVAAGVYFLRTTVLSRANEVLKSDVAKLLYLK